MQAYETLGFYVRHSWFIKSDNTIIYNLLLLLKYCITYTENHTCQVESDCYNKSYVCKSLRFAHMDCICLVPFLKTWFITSTAIKNNLSDG